MAFDFIAAATKALDLAANAVGYARERQQLNNSAEMQDAAKRKAEQEATDNLNKAIAKEDVDETRKNLGL